MNSSTKLLDAVIQEPVTGPANYTIIWLHGLGANGYDFVEIAPSLNLDPRFKIRFIFPHAPSMPVTANGGLVMPAWYDILGWNLEAQSDIDGMLLSRERINGLIQSELDKGIESHRILLVGFSQGGTVALLTALSSNWSLAGAVGLSTYLPNESRITTEIKTAKKYHEDLPIFLAHGHFDPIVPYFVGEKTKEYLISMQFNPAWHGYPMLHMVSFEEIRDLGLWINRQFLSGL